MVHTKFGEYNPEEVELFENDDMQELMFQLEEDMTDCVIVDGNSDADVTHTSKKFSTVTKPDANEENTVCETSEKKGSGNATDAASEASSGRKTVNEEKSVCDMDDEEASMYDLNDVSLTPKEQSEKKKQKREQNMYSSDTVSGADPFNGALFTYHIMIGTK